MSSEALERAATLQWLGSMADDAGPTSTTRKRARWLLAEVARLEQAVASHKHARERKNLELNELEAALAVAREREQRAKKAMVEAAIPLEVLAGQIRTKPYRELTDELQAEIERAVLIIRAALVDEPAAAIPPPEVAALLRDDRPPEAVFDDFRKLHGATLGEPVPNPGSLSAAADEPGGTNDGT